MVGNNEMMGGGEVNNREDVELKMKRIRSMRDSGNQTVSLLEIIVDLLMDIRFGEKKKTE